MTFCYTIAQPLSEKLPLAPDGNKYRDPQPDIMQLATSEHSNLNGVTPSNSSPEAQRPLQRGGRKSVSVKSGYRTPKKEHH